MNWQVVREHQRGPCRVGIRSMSPQFLVIVIFALCLVSISTMRAASWTVRTSQYRHSVWRVQDGVFTGIPQSLVQTNDGYIWVGTTVGLLRFDGMHFTAPTLPPAIMPLLGRVDSLATSSDGSLWIASATLIQLKDGKFFAYPKASGDFVGIVEDPTGGVWLARVRNADQQAPLCHAAMLKITCLGEKDGAVGANASTIFQDRAGNLWLPTTVGIIEGRPGSFHKVHSPVRSPPDKSSEITSFQEGFDGSLLAGSVDAGPGLGLQELKGNHWSSFTRHGLDGSRLSVSALLRGRDNSLWIATENQGIYVIRGGQVDHYGAAEGLSGDSVNSLYQDRENNIWAVTSDGIDCFNIPKVITLSHREGLDVDSAASVLASHDGTVFIGEQNTLNQIKGNEVTRAGTSDGLPRGLITVLLEDHRGSVWVGSGETLSFRQGKRFIPITCADGRPPGMIQELEEDERGDLWGLPAPAGRSLVHVHGDVPRLEAIAPVGSLIYSIAAGPDASLVVSLYDGRLAIYKDGSLTVVASVNMGPMRDMLWLSGDRLIARTQVLKSAKFTGFIHWKPQTLGTQNGLPEYRVYDYLLTKSGDLWLYTSSGLIAIDRAELERWWSNPAAIVRYRLFDSSAGVMPSAATFRSAASEGPDGRLWFANDHKVQMIDPKNITENNLAPPVHIESAIGDKSVYAPQRNTRFPTHLRDLEIDYTALSFTAPKNVRFRYRLDGRDNDWQSPEGRRQAVYTDLPPGHYTFHVIASNNDGVWNTTGDSLNFFIPPALYQTIWFRPLLALATAAFLWTLYVLRLRRAKAELGARLGERLQERERIARALHDTLLQDFQAVILRFQLVANRLAKGDPRRTEVEDGLEYADSVLAEGREHIRDIRADTKAHEGLVESLTIYGRELTHMWPLEFAITSTGKQFPLSPVVRDETYRIAREALGNAFRHSKGSLVTVEVSYTQEALVIRICDDGNGIGEDILRDGRPGHWGINNMRERARKIGASLSLPGLPGGGTCIELRIAVGLANGSRRSWFRLKRRRVSGKRITPARF